MRCCLSGSQRQTEADRHRQAGDTNNIEVRPGAPFAQTDRRFFLSSVPIKSRPERGSQTSRNMPAPYHEENRSVLFTYSSSNTRFLPKYNRGIFFIFPIGTHAKNHPIPNPSPNVAALHRGFRMHESPCAPVSLLSSRDTCSAELILGINHSWQPAPVCLANKVLLVSCPFLPNPLAPYPKTSLGDAMATCLRVHSSTSTNSHWCSPNRYTSVRDFVVPKVAIDESH